jgi:hypothetical protein
MRAATLLAAVAVFGCAALGRVTPAVRAKAYSAEASSMAVICKAYNFDRAARLTLEVPELARYCKP